VFLRSLPSQWQFNLLATFLPLLPIIVMNLANASSNHCPQT
ncbi:uncharacterized protein METZ01_LOCUS128425, partial [marine metagenome]